MKQKKSITHRRFQYTDAEDVSSLICRNFREVNIKDYGEKAVNELAKAYNADKVRKTASNAHMYVFEQGRKLVGCGAIASYWGSETESILLTIFVLPELQGNRIGRQIIQTLEEDELFLRADRVEIPASITGTEFYRKLGYEYKNGIKELDEEGHYRLEKFRRIY